MAVPNINKQNIIDALRYIDENGVPFHNQSTQYDLVTEDGKKYPPKYVIAVADHLANGNEISVETIHGREARKFLQEFGFQIETRLEKYTLTISADSVVSTDERFTTEHLKGDNYKVLDATVNKLCLNTDEIRQMLESGEKFDKIKDITSFFGKQYASQAYSYDFAI